MKEMELVDSTTAAELSKAGSLRHYGVSQWGDTNPTGNTHYREAGVYASESNFPPRSAPCGRSLSWNITLAVRYEWIEGSHDFLGSKHVRTG